MVVAAGCCSLAAVEFTDIYRISRQEPSLLLLEITGKALRNRETDSDNKQYLSI